jgi:methylated-DNA-[protein]-cysteine S-methyltransferase
MKQTNPEKRRFNGAPSDDAPFDERCYALVRKIPKGKVTTYKLLAEALGTRAWRAVGNALSHNPELVTTPCHRVVQSDGGIGGYAGGVERKIALLESEGVTIREGKVADMERYLFRF